MSSTGNLNSQIFKPHHQPCKAGPTFLACWFCPLKQSSSPFLSRRPNQNEILFSLPCSQIGFQNECLRKWNDYGCCMLCIENCRRGEKIYIIKKSCAVCKRKPACIHACMYAHTHAHPCTLTHGY